MNTGGYPDGMSQYDHDKAFGRDATEDEIKTIPANAKPYNPTKSLLMDELFGATEGKQEAGKFGSKPKRRDVE
jgi:hypothetical protein